LGKWINSQEWRDGQLDKAKRPQAGEQENHAREGAAGGCRRFAREEDHDDSGGDQADRGEAPGAENRDSEKR